VKWRTSAKPANRPAIENAPIPARRTTPIRSRRLIKQRGIERERREGGVNAAEDAAQEQAQGLRGLTLEGEIARDQAITV